MSLSLLLDRFHKALWNALIMHLIHQDFFSGWMRCSREFPRNLWVAPNILSSEPKVVLLRLEPVDESIHADLDHIGPAGALGGTFAVLDPTGRSEIGRLGTIIAVIKTRVITERESNHKFT